ncbi:MAG: CPBP family intramembrane metalloprotease [Gammaproteobacteria bacterium]|nr:CPBP family intramembrane metalloprotease [Gammaproteobacteria bacterium]
MKNDKKITDIYQYNPYKYWSLTILITWISFFVVAYFSYSKTSNFLPFMLIGIGTPFVVAMFMIFGSKSKELKQDFKERLCNFKLVQPKYWLIVLLIMPISLFLATTISLSLGQPIKQFLLSPEISKWGWQTFVTLMIVFLAPTLEELGWRGYGVDSLKQGRSFIKASSIYAILWGLWHVPLFFIHGYYHNILLHTNIIYVINFFAQIIVMAFLMNWLYYKNNRSIILIIFFHSMINLFSSIFQTEQFTKIILTIILAIIFIYVLITDKKFFSTY